MSLWNTLAELRKIQHYNFISLLWLMETLLNTKWILATFCCRSVYRQLNQILCNSFVFEISFRFQRLVHSFEISIRFQQLFYSFEISIRFQQLFSCNFQSKPKQITIRYYLCLMATLNVGIEFWQYWFNDPTSWQMVLFEYQGIRMTIIGYIRRLSMFWWLFDMFDSDQFHTEVVIHL